MNHPLLLLCALPIALLLGGCSPDSAPTSAQHPSTVARPGTPAPTPSPNTPTMNTDQTAAPTTSSATSTQTAMFGAGCFWGVEAKFRKIPGVLDTAVGYAGGKMDNPTYKDVCTDATGHAEVVRITFDPARVSYQTLVDAFFTLHDPTTVNRQGPDYGTQYRSVIFVYSPQQQQIASETIQRLTAQQKFPRPIVTQVVPEATFYKAEEYHQRYLEKKGLDNCHI